MISLKDLNVKAVSETPYKFELMFDKKPTGIILHVIGQQSETFERAADAITKEFELAKGMADPSAFMASEQSRKITARLVAARLVGWDGIAEPFTPENALQLVANNDDVSSQVVAESNKVGNFIKL